MSKQMILVAAAVALALLSGCAHSTQENRVVASNPSKGHGLAAMMHNPYAESAVGAADSNPETEKEMK